jgi:hypothetical protein
MSEFKFACPVCGQHMKCDSSQAGSAMECPTCFQKINAPQAPGSDEHKFILSGTKFVEKKTGGPSPGVAQASGVVSGRKFPLWIVLAGIAAVAVAGGVFFLRQPPSNPEPPGQKPHTHTASLNWRAQDIGNVAAAGTMSEEDGVFTITGSGVDIWHRADGFQFVFQNLSGDGSLTARLLNIQNTDEWAKGGVMIRESTNAGSAFALASVRADGQAQSIWRNAAGMEAQASALSGGVGCPKWVKISRNGYAFSMYYKINATDGWLPLGAAQTIRMGTNAVIGLAVCSHNNGVICQAQFDEVALQTNNQPVSK